MPLEPRQDRLGIVVGGGTYRAWTEVELSSDLFVEADYWSVSGDAPEPQFLGAFREGGHCDIYIDDDLQCAGYIDKPQLVVTKERTTLHLSGRDRAAYFVDCEAKAMRLPRLTLKQLAERLIQPSWGIRGVVVDDEANRKRLLGKAARQSTAGATKRKKFFADVARARTKIDPGQKVAAILNDYCERSGVMWWFTADGYLYIGKPQYEQVPAFRFSIYNKESSQARLNNVISATVTRDISGRHSRIEVLGQGRGDGKKLWEKGAMGNRFKAVAEDPDLVARGIDRKLILTSNGVGPKRDVEDRAAREMGRRRLNALTIELEVDGWRQDGRIYTVGTLAAVTIEPANLDGIYWITARTLRGSKSARRASLTLHEMGVYLA
jgi:prophage tail gpP-like protein